jgi:2-polyprenyl-3-methyl-5-hydroxy-6-metoxy-1,4-benzoquinol methylase
MNAKPDLQEQEGYYTQRWNAFEFANQLELRRISAVLNVMARVGYDSTPSICDLGCGAGWSTNILGTFGKTTGVDLSDTAHAALKYPHCQFISANILEWDGPEERFDFVVSLEVIEHIERPLQSRYLEVAHRLLKPGGHLIITTPNATTMRAFPKGGREWSNQPLEEWLTAAELRALLAPNFRIRSVESIIPGMGVRGSYRLVNSAKLQTLLDRVGLGTAWTSSRLRGMYGLHLVAHAQKPARR